MMTRIGSNCGRLFWSHHAACLNNNASALKAKPAVNVWFAHRLLKTIDIYQHRMGTGQPFIDVRSLLSTPVIIPDIRT
jgi:hypothetical protein